NGNILLASTLHSFLDRFSEMTPQRETVWEAFPAGKAVGARSCFQLVRLGFTGRDNNERNLDSIDSLLQYVQHKDVQARKKAALFLGQGRDHEQDRIKGLVQALGDEDAEVRRLACASLSDVGMPALPALVAALKAPRALTRAGAVRTLGLLGRRGA